MKSKLLSWPAIGLVRRAMPAAQRRTAVGGMLLLRLIPAWAISAAAVAFLITLVARARNARAERWA